MQPTIIDCEQYSPEWYAARRGKVSASRLGCVMAKGKSKNEPSATRAKYMAQLAAARLTGTDTEDGYSSDAMEWGKQHEDKARSLYEMKYDVELVTVGLVIHPTLAQACASPDRLVGDDGLVEIKCPEMHTHFARMRGADIETNYFRQMQWQMACTGRKWCDFVSYDPRWPAQCQMVVQRIERDPVMIAEIHKAVSDFLLELDDAVRWLESTYLRQAA